MRFSITPEDGLVVVHIDGELDSITAPELRASFDALADSKPRRVSVDLSALRLIDSSGVGAIVSLFKRILAAGGQFEVSGLQGQPRSIFQVLRLDRVFKVE